MLGYFERTLSFGQVKVSTPDLDLKKEDRDRLCAMLEQAYGNIRVVCEKCGSSDTRAQLEVCIDNTNLLTSGKFTCGKCGYIMEQAACADPNRLGR